MEDKIKGLIDKLKKENEQRSEAMSRGTLSDYNHTVKVHTYNSTLEVIKQLQEILNS